MKIVSKEFMFKELINVLSKILNQYNFKVELTDNIDQNDEDLYIIVGYYLTNLLEMPKNYIVIQYEYVIGDIASEQYIQKLQGAKSIWNYSIHEIDKFKIKIDKSLFTHTPLYYSSYMDSKLRINDMLKDIDILINIPIDEIERRKSIVNELNEKNYNIHITTHSLLTNEKIKLFHRSKIILNILFNESDYIDLYDYWYFLNNHGFLITEINEKERQNYEKYMICTDYDSLIEKCIYYLENPNERSLKNKLLFKNWKTTEYNIPIEIIKKYEKPLKKTKKNKINGMIDWYLPTAIKSVEIEKLKETHQVKLKLPYVSDDDLPYVSIVTPTKNRKFIFELPIYNFTHFNYPPHKLEWIIIDNGTENLKDILPDDKRIKYITVEPDKYSIGELRNLSIENSSHEYIVYMDDDDYYDINSVRARIISLLKYKEQGIECVGCETVPFFNLINGENMTGSNKKNYLCEASMAHTKDFWRKRRFNNDKIGEFRYFLIYRQHQVLHIPYEFIIIALNHNVNTTGLSRFSKKEVDESWKNTNFSKVYFQYFPEEIKKILLNCIKERTLEHYELENEDLDKKNN